MIPVYRYTYFQDIIIGIQGTFIAVGQEVVVIFLLVNFSYNFADVIIFNFWFRLVSFSLGLSELQV